eukprot:s4195_g1.t1
MGICRPHPGFCIFKLQLQGLGGPGRSGFPQGLTLAVEELTCLLKVALIQPTRLDAFAKELSDDVFVAKMDGTLNDLPVSGFKVKGYPTLFFIEAGQKEPTIQQIGSNAVHAMRRFMEGKGCLVIASADELGEFCVMNWDFWHDMECYGMI